MKAGRNAIEFLRDILESIEKIEQFTGGFEFDTFSKDDKTVYAVIRALEIMGEATKNLPDSLKEDHPEVPWRLMAGIRDKVIHGYFVVDLPIIWNTVKKDVPELHPLIADILEEFESV